MQPGQKIRDYILEARLGAGGMGEVWHSRHELLDRSVAIKVVSDELLNNLHFEELFLKEARAQARLRHPHIVPVSDFFREGHRLHLVMPLIEGESLAARLNRGPLSLDEALQIAEDVLAALDYAHQQGVIHRDVKPSNIILDHAGRAYLMDFGIALLLNEERKTRTGQSFGTPHYMSPEQIRNPKLLDHRSDVYSFGCVLYEMLTGDVPFDATSEEGDVDYIIKESHVHHAPTPLRERNKNVPEAVAAVVMRAMAKNPNERFAGCGEFARVLAQATKRKEPSLEPVPVPSPVPLPTPKPVPPVPVPPKSESTFLVAPETRVKFVLLYVLLSVAGNFMVALFGNDPPPQASVILGNVLLGTAQYVMLRNRLKPARFWIAGYIGVGFVTGACFQLFITTITSAAEYRLLSALSAAVGGIILWDVVRRQVQETWFSLLVGPVAIAAPFILFIPPEMLAGEFDQGMFYSAYRGFVIGLVQALCLIRLHRKENVVRDDQKAPSRSLGGILLRMLIGALSSTVLVTIVVILVNLSEGYSRIDAEEAGLIIIFGGALPGAIIGLFASLLRRTLHLLIYGVMVMSVTGITIVEAQGDPEKAPLALLLGIIAGGIIAAIQKAVTALWLKSS